MQWLFSCGLVVRVVYLLVTEAFIAPLYLYSTEKGKFLAMCVFLSLQLRHNMYRGIENKKRVCLKMCQVVCMRHLQNKEIEGQWRNG